MTTIAQEIAAKWNNNGMRWHDNHGESIAEYAGQFGEKFGQRGGWERVAFTDGSALLFGPVGWDIETGARWTLSSGDVIQWNVI